MTDAMMDAITNLKASVASAVRRCSDCKHCRPDRSMASFFGLDREDALKFAKCAATSDVVPDIAAARVGYVSRSALRMNFCAVERVHTPPVVRCGVDGLLWEAK